MLESYETSMNGFLRWVHESRTVVDGGLSELKGAHLQPINNQITPDVINDLCKLS